MRFMQPTPKQENEWAEWVVSRPPVVREIAKQLDPWTLYRMKSTGQRVTLFSISESGTVTVDITGQFNALLHERRVFGIDPEDLEPCDLPGPDEKLGAALTAEQVDENIDVLRVHVRPDLWTMGADGKAHRKH